MKALLAIVSTAAVFAAPAYADCPYPTAPAALPDGRTATMEQMMDGQKAVKAYDKAVDAYVACIDKELDASLAKNADLKPEQKKDMQNVETQKHNAAIDQEQAVADRFNEQVKVFKARTADSK